VADPCPTGSAGYGTACWTLHAIAVDHRVNQFVKHAVAPGIPLIIPTRGIDMKIRSADEIHKCVVSNMRQALQVS
jgi:hypothetical protein